MGTTWTAYFASKKALIDITDHVDEKAIEIIELRYKEKLERNDIINDLWRMKERIVYLQEIKIHPFFPIIEMDEDVKIILKLVKEWKEGKRSLMENKVIKEILESSMNKIVYTFKMDKMNKDELIGVSFEVFDNIIKEKVQTEEWKDIFQIKNYFYNSLYYGMFAKVLDEKFPGIPPNERNKIMKFLKDKAKVKQEEGMSLSEKELKDKLIAMGWTKEKLMEMEVKKI